MTPVVVVIIIVAIVVIAIGAVLYRRSRRPDGVAQFQRQIDALSPEARRPVVDRLQQLEEEAETASPPTEPAEDDEP